MCLAVGIIGLSYGATAVAAGFPLWLPVVLGVLVHAAGSEFLFVGIVAAGGSPIAAVFAGLLVNSRHIPYGLAVPDVLGTGWRRLLGVHLMNDETVVMAIAQPEMARKRAAYWACGLGILACWPVGAALGGVIGSVVPRHRRARPGRDVPRRAARADPADTARPHDPVLGAGRRDGRARDDAVPARRPPRAGRAGRCPGRRPGKPDRLHERGRRMMTGVMSAPVVLVGAILVLAAGTFAFRFAGPALHTKITFPPRVAMLLETASVVLLAALVVTSGITEASA